MSAIVHHTDRGEIARFKTSLILPDLRAIDVAKVLDEKAPIKLKSARRKSAPRKKTGKKVLH
jgi:hypothetical protein